VDYPEGEEMSGAPRLNGIIRALESGQHAFATFAHPEASAAIQVATTRYDGVIFEGEHNPWDTRELRDCLQYMLVRKDIAKSASLAPAVTPLIRVPPNGSEMSQVFAKQALDVGAYGIVWPHISDASQAYNAVAACRYPSLKSAPLYEPKGLRGDGPTTAVRYWGLSQQEYYERADVWPLNPEGELLTILMIEDTVGISNLPDILENVPGIGAILIGEGDLSQELGHPRDFNHPEVVSAMAEIVDVCRRFDVAVGHPHVNRQNIERVMEQGYRFLVTGAERTYEALDIGLRQATRS
jgi:4-hydroxy-2-oxoheptanedioate aldolase